MFNCYHNCTILKEEKNVIYDRNSPHLFSNVYEVSSLAPCHTPSVIVFLQPKTKIKVGLFVRALESKIVGGDQSHVLPHQHLVLNGKLAVIKFGRCLLRKMLSSVKNFQGVSL